MNHTNEEARKIWADQDSMPDVLNQEPQSECTADDFDVVLSAPTWVWNQGQTIRDFLDSGGELYERYFPKLGRSFFVATRGGRVTGYGESPLESIIAWAHEVKH
jgi:hypothetical protein